MGDLNIVYSILFTQVRFVGLHFISLLILQYSHQAFAPQSQLWIDVSSETLSNLIWHSSKRSASSSASVGVHGGALGFFFLLHYDALDMRSKATVFHCCVFLLLLVACLLMPRQWFHIVALTSARLIWSRQGWMVCYWFVWEWAQDMKAVADARNCAGVHKCTNA